MDTGRPVSLIEGRVDSAMTPSSPIDPTLLTPSIEENDSSINDESSIASLLELPVA